MGRYSFEVKLARDAALSFSEATGLGCAVTSANGGEVLCETGYACMQCSLCAELGRDAEVCAHTHLYGMTEAERFGGKYIYFCQRGLTFFVSPIIGRGGSEAKLTVGPFLMVDREDFLACELTSLTEQRRQALAPLLEELPFVNPERVTRLSQLLFMAVGFLNNVAAAERLREREASDGIQGQINAYIMEIKQELDAAPYPFDKERALLNEMVGGNRKEATRLLNELLGHILLLDGVSLDRMKTRCYELLVMMSRTAVESGADPNNTQEKTHRYFQQLNVIRSLDELCHWLTIAMNELISSIFVNQDIKHASVIHRSIQYIRTHLGEKLDLEKIARSAYLSPDYFSRIFREETGQTMSQFILEMRLKKSVELMRHPDLSLADIAHLVGFEDQSYFSRVFQKAYGQSPRIYRQRNMK